MSTFRRPTIPSGTDPIVYTASDFHTFVDMLNGNISGIPPVKFKSAEGISFWDGVMRIKDITDDSRELVIKSPSGLAASRNLSLPAVSVNDTIATISQSQTFLNKIINLSDNTLTDTSAASGEIVVHNGTKYVRLAAGTTSQFLRGDGVWATAPGPAGGEANTASNVGTAGVGLFKQKSGLDFQFKNLNSGSSKITLVNSTDTVDVDVDSSTFNLADFGGTLTVAKGGTGATTLTGIISGNGTSAFTAASAPSGSLVGTTESQTLTGKTLNATNNTITDTSTAAGDIFKSNGTKFLRLGRGAAGKVLKVNVGGTDIGWDDDLTGGEGGGGAGFLVLNNTNSTVSNTAAYQTMITHTFSSGNMGTSKQYQLVVIGTYSNTSGSSNKLWQKITFGGTVMFEGSIGTIDSATPSRAYFAVYYFNNKNVANSQNLGGWIELSDASTATTGISELVDDEASGRSSVHGNTTIDTSSASRTLLVEMTHDSANSNVTFTRTMAFLREI